MGNARKCINKGYSESIKSKSTVINPVMAISYDKGGRLSNFVCDIKMLESETMKGKNIEERLINYSEIRKEAQEL